MRDFHDRQQKAESRTGYLIFLLTVATVATVVVTGLVVGYAVVLSAYVLALYTKPLPLLPIFVGSFASAAAFALLIVIAGAIYKSYQLRGGGEAVALSLGGIQVLPGDPTPKHRQLLNIVEEIAIAIGIPAPPVYLLPHEGGINAFAAGFEPQNAVIGVTRGCVERLNRDQLQGVVAHEFSHITNGDMQLNMQSLAVLHGILCIAVVAEELMQLGYELWQRQTGSKDDSGNGLLMMALGALMWPVGQIGTACAALVTAGINRQREYLADASAVEYTRNPLGLAGALKVIGGFTEQSQLRSAKSSELSHLFFANCLRRSSQWLATHPSLIDRIQRLDPEWDGIPIYEETEELPQYRGAFQGTLGLVAGGPELSAIDQEQQDFERRGLTDPGVEACLRQWQTQQQREVEQRISAELLAFADDTATAPIVLWGLLLGADGLVEPCEREWLAASYQETVSALAQVTLDLGPAERVYLMDRALRALDESVVTGEHWQEMLRRLAQSGTNSWAESGWQWLLEHSTWRRDRSEVKVRYPNLRRVTHECAVVLSGLINATGVTGPMAEFTFHRAAGQLELEGLEWLIVNRDHLLEFYAALDNLAATPARCRRQLLIAMSLCFTADGQITMDEAVLARVVCLALGYPSPSLLPGDQVLAGV